LICEQSQARSRGAITASAGQAGTSGRTAANCGPMRASAVAASQSATSMEWLAGYKEAWKISVVTTCRSQPATLIPGARSRLKTRLGRLSAKSTLKLRDWRRCAQTGPRFGRGIQKSADQRVIVPACKVSHDDRKFGMDKWRLLRRDAGGNSSTSCSHPACIALVRIFCPFCRRPH
jgi:hypothetical protein